MNDTPQTPSPIAAAVAWVGRITAVALLMMLPGLGGRWLDQRFGTQFLALLGFVLGLIGGIACLLVMTGAYGGGGGPGERPGNRDRTDQDE